MTSDAQKRAVARYEAAKVHQAKLKFFPSEEDLWEHLQRQPNKMGYIKELIRADMEKGRR